jgi:hypothetical protein
MNAKSLFIFDFGSLAVLLLGISALSYLALNGF